MNYVDIASADIGEGRRNSAMGALATLDGTWNVWLRFFQHCAPCIASHPYDWIAPAMQAVAEWSAWLRRSRDDLSVKSI